ncbi:MAG: NAD(P)/FAD-dependent oxidoreductase [Xanthobacteraceae bacterium]
MTHYDAVVVGAGLGGLTTAAILARAGRKVLVIERGNSVGGAASSYKVGDLFVEGSLHETSNPRRPTDPKHDVLNRAGVRDAVEWIPSNEFYEVRGGPLVQPFALPDNLVDAYNALALRFPLHRAAIRQLLDEMRAIASAADDTSPANAGPSLAQKCDALFGGDEAIKCTLAANLCYYHDDPASLPWHAFARAQGRYLLNGACFVRGGSQRLSSALARAIRAAGGTVLLRRVATHVSFDNNDRPISVTHTSRDGDDPQTAGCDRVAVNAAPTAATAMLPGSIAMRWSEAYTRRQPSISLFTLTLGLAESPRRHGITSYSTQLLPDWMTRLTDYAAATRLMANEPDGRMPPLAIANYDAIDSGIPAPPYTLSIIGPDHIDNWREPSAERYHAKRANWQAALLRHLDMHFPGLSRAVVATSFNTAHSVQSYLGAPQGAVYGFAPNTGPGSPRTPLQDVYLASAYAGSGGYSGVIEAAGACADIILRDSGLDVANKAARA